MNKKKPRAVYKFNNTDFNEVRMDAIKLSKTLFARNPLDYSVEDNWQFFKAGLMESYTSSLRESLKKTGFIE